MDVVLILLITFWLQIAAFYDIWLPFYFIVSLKTWDL